MKIFLLSLLVLLALVKSSVAQNVDWNLVEQHYFETYQPTDTPAWIFPIIAINGDGLTDTIYYCYKSYANDYNVYETAFGEKVRQIDTSSFNLSFGTTVFDSTVKVFAFGDVSFSGYIDIGFTNLVFTKSTYPIYLKWNSNKLFETNLPFPNILPKPIAKIGGFWSHYYTPFIFGTAESFIIADTTGLPVSCLYANAVNLFKDSIIFSGPLNVDPNDFLYVELSLRKQQGDCILGSVKDLEKDSVIDCTFISQHQIKTTSKSNNTVRIILYDILGKALLKINLTPYSSYIIDCKEFDSSMFILSAFNNKYSQTFKIIRQ